MKSIKWIGLTIIAALVLLGGTKRASADDCLELGWKDKGGSWTYYRAFVDAQDGNHLALHYDYHHGQLELKVFEKEKGDGSDVIVLKGRWFEGKDGQRTGKVRLELAKGHHRAKGWYTYGDDDTGTHYDMALRECKR